MLILTSFVSDVLTVRKIVRNSRFSGHSGCTRIDAYSCNTWNSEIAQYIRRNDHVRAICSKPWLYISMYSNVILDTSCVTINYTIKKCK